MKFITKISVACATVAMMASTLCYAGTVTTGKLQDNYIGAYANNTSYSDYMPTNNPNYNTHWMKVSRDLDAGSLTVKVKSSFVGYNSKYKLGDLFLMDAGKYNAADKCNDSSVGADAFGCSENSYSSGTNKWEYAFDLGLDYKDGTNNSTSNYTDQDGTLRKIDTSGSVTSSGSSYHSDVNTASQLQGGRSWQIVDVKSSATEVSGGKWYTNVNNEFLSMTFDISGTSLMDAEQLALRWAMSCANDIIEVVTNFKPNKPPGGGTAVPEPSTFILMLLAVFGLFASRQKKVVGFKA